MNARLVLPLCVWASISGMVSAIAPGCMTSDRYDELTIGQTPSIQSKLYLTKGAHLAAEVCIRQSFQTIRMSAADLLNAGIGTFTAAAKNTRIISCKSPADSVTHANTKVKGAFTCFTWNEGLGQPVSAASAGVLFVFEAYSNGVIQGAGASAPFDESDWDKAQSVCSIPCGGCGIELQFVPGSAIRYRACGIRQCVRGSDPATLPYRWVKKRGRMVRVAREMQCCYNFKGGQAVERTNPKPCRFRKINGWVANNQSPFIAPDAAFSTSSSHPVTYIHPLGYTRVF